jgi:hypothetical protein
MATPAMQQYGKPKTPKQHFQQIRLKLESLAEEYGLDLRPGSANGLAIEARRMQVPQRPLHHQPALVPCRAELDGIGTADPCLIVPATWPVELLPPHRHVAVGGQVKSIEPSRYLLPKCVLDAAWRSRLTWQGCLMPVLVMIKGDQKYLVRAKSWFFQCGEYCGQDIDASFTSEPNERDLNREAYSWGDDMNANLTLVLAKL